VVTTCVPVVSGVCIGNAVVIAAAAINIVAANVDDVAVAAVSYTVAILPTTSSHVYMYMITPYVNSVIVAAIEFLFTPSYDVGVADDEDDGVATVYGGVTVAGGFVRV